MHRTDGPDYEIFNGKRIYKESPTGTVVNRNAITALQEEVSGAVESAGIALRPNGASDRAANYQSQLAEAIDKQATTKSHDTFWNNMAKIRPLMMNGFLPRTKPAEGGKYYLYLAEDAFRNNACTFKHIPHKVYTLEDPKKLIYDSSRTFNADVALDQQFEPWSYGTNGGICPIDPTTKKVNIQVNKFIPLFVAFNKITEEVDICAGTEEEGQGESMAAAMIEAGWISQSSEVEFRLIGYMFISQVSNTRTLIHLHHRKDGWIYLEQPIISYTHTAAVDEWRDFKLKCPFGVYEIYRERYRMYKINLFRRATPPTESDFLIREYKQFTTWERFYPTVNLKMHPDTVTATGMWQTIELRGRWWQEIKTAEYAEFWLQGFYVERGDGVEWNLY